DLIAVIFSGKIVMISGRFFLSGNQSRRSATRLLRIEKAVEMMKSHLNDSLAYALSFLPET
ncbi:MAG: hypothetical protein JTJ20_12655, partial [Blautia sp.]|nr:hypothetical protein [Blautia sp.]